MRHRNLERLLVRGFAVGCLFLFTAVDARSESAPSCSDSAVTDTVLSLARKATGLGVDPLAQCMGATSPDCATTALSTGAPPDAFRRVARLGFNVVVNDFSTAKLSLSAIRTREQTNVRAQCAAHLQLEVGVRSGADAKRIFGPEGIGNYARPPGPSRSDLEIEYTVERTDDGQDYITLNDF